MAITVVTNPAALVGAYSENSLLWEFKEEFAYTGVSDNGGDLQLTVSLAAAGEVEVGDYIWVSGLVGRNYIDSPVQRVKGKGSTSLLLDLDYEAISTGNIRLMRSQDFNVRTGIGTTAQPYKNTSVVNVTPNPSGIYRVNAKQAVLSRFGFNAPVAADPASDLYTINLVDLVTGPISPTQSVALRQKGTDVAAQISYDTNLVSLYSQNRYVVQEESATTQNLNDGDAVNLYYLSDKTVTVNFNTPMQDADTTISPSPLPTGVTLITSSGGQQIDGITIDASLLESRFVALSFEDDDGINPVITYVINLYVAPVLESRTICASKSLRLFWWHPLGGWVSYSFETQKSYGIDGNQASLAETNGERFVNTYEDQRTFVELIAGVEGQAVLDYLNTIFETTLHFIYLGGGLGTASNYRKVFIDGGGQSLKTVDRFRPTSNRFRVRLRYAKENAIIGQQ